MPREGNGGYSFKIMSEEQTGIFGKGNGRPPHLTIKGLLQMIGPTLGMRGGTSGGGSGPYKSSYFSIPDLPRHTIYQPDPSKLPLNLTLPVILWGNGACACWGAWFSKFLAEISSHGYFIIANGIPQASGLFKSTKWTDMMEAIEWVDTHAGIGEYLHVDKTHLAAAGQSCGGLQAYTASLDPRVTLTVILNSGLVNEENRVHFEELHAPIGYFSGGPTDIAYPNGERDYEALPATIPRVKLDLPVGHMGTYGTANGGKFGKAAVAFFEWQMRDDQVAKKLFLEPESSELARDGWCIKSEGWTDVGVSDASSRHEGVSLQLQEDDRANLLT